MFVTDEWPPLRITNMLNADNEETDDPNEATRLVAEMPDGKWLAAECSADEIVEAQLS